MGTEKGGQAILLKMLYEFVHLLFAHPRALYKIVIRRVRYDGRWMLLRVLRSADSPGKTRLLNASLRFVESRRRGKSDQVTLLVKVLCLEGLGEREKLRQLARDVAPHASPSCHLMMSAIMLELTEPELTLALLAGEGETPKVLHRRGLAKWQVGNVAEAIGALQKAETLSGGDRRIRRDGERIQGNLSALTPSWRPQLEPLPVALEPVPRRILHFLNNSLPYVQAGYTIRSQRIAEAQRDVGLDPHLATRAGFPALQGYFRAPNKELIEKIPYYRLEGRELGGASYDEVVERNATMLCELAEEIRPSVLHPTTNYMNAQAALAVRDRVGIPTVYEVRGFLEETWLTMRGEESVESEQIRMVRAVETRCMEEADAVVTLSQSMAAEIAYRGVNKHKITVVPNAVDPEEFQPGHAEPGLRERLGLREQEIVIGYVSSLVRYEGLQFLLEAIAHLLSIRGEVRGLVVGEGPERRHLENQAAELGVGGSVIFTGRVPYRDILSYYGAIDIFVVPRTGARVCQLVSPLKPLEAMAMECPIVVSDVPPLRELVECGAGKAFTPEDSGDLARTLLPLIENGALRRELGSNGRKWIMEERTWRKNAVVYSELYRQLGAWT